MLNENAKKWVAALRSGKYKQGKGKLRHEGRYCCLGVACDISGLVAWEHNSYDDEEYELTSQIKNWLGLNTSVGSYYESTTLLTLVALNDSGKSFSEIADIIESEPDGLFEKP